MAKKKVPKSQLRSFSYLCGGGMNIESNDEASLWRHDDGKLTLTLRGTCPFEKVTFEVGEDVFLRCDSIIKARPQIEQDIAAVIADCDDYEIRMIRDVASALKETLRKNKNLQQS